jgi:uncharacterized protein with NRDE domain
MCTLLLALQATARTPLAASGNRNEFLARPASGPRLYPAAKPGTPTVVMPRDEKALGTWLGFNDRGVFVCLTNRRGPSDPARASRGELVVQALQKPGVAALREFLQRVPAERYNGFHLVFATAREAAVLICDGSRSELRELGPGLHLITERSFGAGEGAREKSVLREFEELFQRGEPDLIALREPLRRHGPAEAPLESACVHADAQAYGTRSSLQLRVPDQGPATALWTEGHPCTEPAQEISTLVAPLFRRDPGR